MELKCKEIVELMDKYHVQGLSLALLDEKKNITIHNYGVISAKNGRKIDNHSRFNTCSISKFITAVLVLKLVEQRILELDEDVNDKLISWKVPDNDFTVEKKVTLRLLLSHQSGVVDPKGSFEEYDKKSDIPKMVDILAGVSPYCNEPIIVSYQPESKFCYSDAGYCIIQQLVEDVMKTSFEEVIEEYIFKPLGMVNSSYMNDKDENSLDYYTCGHDKHGDLIEDGYIIYPYSAAAGLWSTTSDIGILVWELLNTLQGTSKIGLSKSMIQVMFSPQGCSQWVGLGVFLDSHENELEVSSLGWGKGYQGMVVAYPNSGTGAIIMTNTDLGVHQMQGIIGDIYRNIHFCPQ